MTKFGEECTLNCVAVTNFFQLPVTFKKESCYLVNEDRRSVSKIHDRKLQHSWRLKHPHSFTSPVVYDSEDESVYCVIDNNKILRWSYSAAEDNVLKIASKFKFQETVFGVIPVQGHKPVIIFTSGQVVRGDTLGTQAAPTGKSLIADNEKLIWANAAKLNSEIYVVCLSKKNKDYLLHHFTITEDGVDKYHNHTLSHETNDLKSWCLNKTTHSVITIWSNGQILNYDINTQDESTLMTIPDVNTLHLAIDCIDSNHVVIIKSMPKHKGACLEMWDVKFKALKAKKVLKTVATADTKLSVLDSVLLFSCKDELIEVSYHVEKSTLAAAVGKSLSVAPKIQEFSWNKGKLTQLSNAEQNDVERMDTSENKKVPLNPTELLAQRLMEEGSLYLDYIPEAELVKLLQLAIRCKLKKKDDLNIDPDVILNTISCASFSDVFLLKFMKKLSLEDTRITLEILLSFLNDESPSATNSQKPSDLQLFNWICLVLQSHMEALLLTKDRKIMKLIEKLSKCVSQKMEEYKDLESIENLFHVIQKKKDILPEKYVIGKYCIEKLDT